MNTIARKLPTVARVVLGLVFVVFGLNGFLHFLPQPPVPAGALPFVTGMASAGYFFPLLKGTEVAMGALLLAGVAVPFALTVLAPIVLNIVAFHLFLAPGNYPLVALVLGAELYLAWVHRGAYAALFSRRAVRLEEGAAGSELRQALPAGVARG